MPDFLAHIADGNLPANDRVSSVLFVDFVVVLGASARQLPGDVDLDALHLLLIVDHRRVVFVFAL